MKKYFRALMFVCATLVAFTSCKKDSLTNLADLTFKQSYSEDIDIPEGIADTLVPLPTPQTLPFSYTFATGIQQIVNDYNTSTDKLVSVKVDSVTISALLPAGQNLDFLNNIELFLSANGLPEKSIARKDPVPRGQTTVVLDAMDVNLKDYFLKDSVTVRINATVNALPATGTKLRFGNKYAITANPLK